jgi:asparagine synthase (glutamine-hydrolysing)
MIEGGHAICHERLGIVDPESGAQPLVSDNDGERTILAVNGEIYNYREVYAALKTPYTPMTGSDCECVIPLFQQVRGADGKVDVAAMGALLNQLRGTRRESRLAA